MLCFRLVTRVLGESFCLRLLCVLDVLIDRFRYFGWAYGAVVMLVCSKMLLGRCAVGIVPITGRIISAGCRRGVSL